MIKTKTYRYLDKEESEKIMLLAAADEIFSSNQLAKHLGLSSSYLSMILNGKRALSRRVFNKLVSRGYLQ